MTDRTFAEIKSRAADLWVAQHGEHTPLDIYPVAYIADMRDWLRAKGFPIGSLAEILLLSKACAERVQGLRRAQKMVESSPGFDPGQDG